MDTPGTVASNKDRIVYSTDIGTRCPNCLRAIRDCVCRKGTPGKVGDGIVRVSRETQGRKGKGKGVTVIAGLGLATPELHRLATQLKKRCGSGGTVAEDRIEIQGDHRDAIVLELTAQGMKVKRAGG
jgi:translation initiation factor 1